MRCTIFGRFSGAGSGEDCSKYRRSAIFGRFTAAGSMVGVGGVLLSGGQIAGARSGGD